MGQYFSWLWSNSPTTLENLPDHILVDIFRHLDQRCRVRMLKVDKRWRRLMPFVNLCVDDMTEPIDPNERHYIYENDYIAELQEILPVIGARLHSIDLRHIRLAPEQFVLMAQFCPNLQSIDRTDFLLFPPNDFNFPAIEQMSRLKTLKLGDGDFIRSEPIDQAKLARLLLEVSNLIGHLELKKFQLKFLPIPPALVTPNLSHLELFWIESFTDEQLDQICTDLPNLNDLRVIKCWGVTDFTPVGRLSNLTYLKLRCTNVNDAHMNVIAYNCPRLEVLRLDHSMKLWTQFEGNSHIVRLSWIRFLSTLRCLAIDWTKRKLADIPYPWGIEELELPADLSDANMLDLSDKSPWLKRLHLYLGNLSENVVVQLADRWEFLEELRLTSDCRTTSLSDEIVVQLGQRESLRRLDIREFHQVVSADCFSQLLAKRQELKVSTPLNIQLGHARVTKFSSELIDKLKAVKVQLID